MNNTTTSTAITAMDSTLNQPTAVNWWPEFLQTGNYLCNLSPSSVTGMTPYEGWYGDKPNLSHFRIIGCIALAKKKEADRRKFIDTKAIRCKLLGHTTYRLLTEEGRILRSNNGNRPEQANTQDPSNDASVIDHKALTDVRKERPMHNLKHQTNRGSTYRQYDSI